MLSSSDLERLIAVKKIEIEEEKTHLGLSPQREASSIEDEKENAVGPIKHKKQVNFTQNRALSECNDVITQKKEKDNVVHQELEDKIPPDLERYIRRYLGLPVMLRAGEYSPNNPLIRGERTPGAGDALLGLGEYERQRHTLRRIRQQQYREYLDQQAKKKQEAKEQVERERRERDEREREREQKERELLLERERATSVGATPERRRHEHSAVTSTVYCSNKVDTGVQVDRFSRPLSVAVQTDEAELFRLSPSPGRSQLTPAERELSPRTVGSPSNTDRRRSYGDYDERPTMPRKASRDKLAAELRHTYMPSIFDADAIQLRNEQAEKEAAERRQYYQQELKNQILEQQRIREERKSREKMLEQAEMRRLEEQLRMLRVAQERELGKQHDITAAMKENTREYNTQRTELQKEIDAEQRQLIRASTQSTRSTAHRTNPSKPQYHPKTHTPTTPEHPKPTKPPYSTNIPDNSIFSTNYDVDSYLRRNLNFKKGSFQQDYPDIEWDSNKPNNFPMSYGKQRSKFNVNMNSDNDFPNIEKGSQDQNTDIEWDSNKPVNFPMSYGKQRSKFNDINESNVKMNSDNDFPNIEKGSQDQNTDIEWDSNKPVNFPMSYGKQRSKFNDDNNKNNTTNYLDVQNNCKTESNIKMNSDNDFPNIEKGSQDQNCMIYRNRSNEPSDNYNIDLAIPVLKHTPITQDTHSVSDVSEKMKRVEDKWKVPVIQKNILKSIPNEEGKNVSILTQLGSIRRQLQLEQLKLDGLSNKD